MVFECPPISELKEAISSPSSPVGMRMRAAYYLRQLYEGCNKDKREERKEEEHTSRTGTASPVDVENNQNHDITGGRDHDDDGDQLLQMKVIEYLSEGLRNVSHGSLMRHEFAYVMGQLRDIRCCQVLEEVLLNSDDCIIVRHECGEALGAIGAIQSIPILEEAIASNPNTPEIYHTCEISIAHMKWKLDQISNSNNHVPNQNSNSNNHVPNQISNLNNDFPNLSINHDPPIACACMLSPYSSIDPAPPHPKHINISTSQLGSILKDTSLPLFDRYQAMFSLRNRGGHQSVLQLGEALLQDHSSPLLRHEIAYVLGQMQHPTSLPHLHQSLARTNEHPMVRHEAAEALGAIEDKWPQVQSILTQYLQDPSQVVRESCIVALDAVDYWSQSSTSKNTQPHNTQNIQHIHTFTQQKAQPQIIQNHFNTKIT